MAVSNTTPVTFELPDGDRVELCTWPYIVSKLEELITPITSSLTATNNALLVIESKVDSWLEEDQK